MRCPLCGSAGYAGLREYECLNVFCDLHPEPGGSSTMQRLGAEWEGLSDAARAVLQPYVTAWYDAVRDEDEARETEAEARIREAMGW